MLKATRIFILLGILALAACRYDELGLPSVSDGGDLTDIPYDPQPYVVVTSPNMEILQLLAMCMIMANLEYLL